MNKLVTSLLFCGFVGCAASSYGSPAAVDLNTGTTISVDSFNRYIGYLTSECKENPNQHPLCAQWLAMAKMASANHGNAAALAGYKDPRTVDEDDALDPEFAELVKASLKEKEPQDYYEAVNAFFYGKSLEFVNPLAQSTSNPGAGKPRW
jgi:hypothetical protein